MFGARRKEHRHSCLPQNALAGASVCIQPRMLSDPKRNRLQAWWAHRPDGLCSTPGPAKFQITISSALIVAIWTGVTGCARGPGPDDTVRNAYAWYVQVLKSGVNPLEQKRTELKEFVTEGFLSSLDNMRPELEASPFMDAQSFDAKLSIKKITKDSRAATVRITLSGRISGQHVFNVYLVKIEGRWKVDDVKEVEEFSLARKTAIEVNRPDL